MPSVRAYLRYEKALALLSARAWKEALVEVRGVDLPVAHLHGQSLAPHRLSRALADWFCNLYVGTYRHGNVTLESSVTCD